MLKPTICLFFLLVLALGKGVGQAPIPKDSGRSEMTVVVKKHNTGADMVEITALDPRYPKDLLLRQAVAIGTEVGTPARGLQVYEYTLDPKDPNMNLVKASFALNGLIDSPTGILRLQPIARAFAGVPEPHTVHALTVIFDGERPSSNTVRLYNSLDLHVEGSYNPNLNGTEYRIVLHTQDPKQIVIPETAAPAPRHLKKVEEVRTVWPVVALLAVAALAAGCLVYWLLQRGPARTR